MKKNIYFFIPNIIGYIRIILALFGFVLYKQNIYAFVTCYIITQILDGLDGWVARNYNQTSVFGQVLDQITDRLSTCLLYILISNAYNEYVTYVVLIMIVDIGGHYFHSISCAIAGNKSHKKIEKGNKFLKLYYEYRALMVISIAAYESFLVCLYLHQVLPNNTLLYKLSYCNFILSFPLATFKVFINAYHGIYGIQSLVEMDTKKQ